jgi:hypothetical protein
VMSALRARYATGDQKVLHHNIQACVEGHSEIIHVDATDSV